MIGILILLAAAPLAAAVDGVVTNLTTGRPQAGVTVALYRLASNAGMDHVSTVRSGEGGSFSMSQTPQGPHLIQATWEGVSYNHMLPAGQATTGLNVSVWSASAQPGEAKVSAHMIVFEPGASTLTVSENFIFQNPGKRAYNDPEGGTLKFFAPGAEGQIRVMATAPQGMPVAQLAQKTTADGVFKVVFPVKPGETDFELSYTVPFTSPGTFTGKVLHGDALPRVVAPPGVSLTSDSLTLLGQEPQSMASVYELTSRDYTVQIEGTGTLAAAQQASAGEEEGQGLQSIRPRLYDRYLPVVGLAFLILALGFVLLMRKREQPAAVVKGKRR